MRIFIGYDSREVAAYHVLASSIIRKATRPVALIPVALHQLAHGPHLSVGVAPPFRPTPYTRKRGPTESTEFSLTRFLVPYLSGYEGWSVFMDCDMLCLCDITDLMLDMSMNEDKAVLVVKHKYEPKTLLKMDGQVQTRYPRKNWSSFMAFNNARCRDLTPHYVNLATGLDLHRFAWIHDDQIGGLPPGWNHLVGEYDDDPSARVLHYTMGGPWMAGYEGCDRAEDWRTEAAAAGFLEMARVRRRPGGPRVQACNPPLGPPGGLPAGRAEPTGMKA
jgi:hypothetical protein